jgi:hypothetical protein
MRHAMVNESDGHKKVQRIIDWLEIKSYIALGTEREQSVSIISAIVLTNLY